MSHAACTIRSTTYLPGALWPVFPAATRRVKDLFGVNERRGFHLDTPFGAMAEVMVGAFGVGRMSTVLDGAVTNHRKGR